MVEIAANNPSSPSQFMRRRPDQLVEGFVIPADPAVNPAKAVAAVVRLLRNKEDTSQVFEITRSLTGGAMTRAFRRFAQSHYGRRVMTAPIILESALADFEKLRAMPDGSFGRIYLAFMESGGLTPDGIQQVAEGTGIDFRGEEYPEFHRYFCHLTASHDVWHVLTGYNRDAMGELCLLAFTRQQSGNDAFRLITAMGAAAIKKENPTVPIYKALREARQTAQACAWFYEVDFVALLPKPIDEVRKQLAVRSPLVYQSVPETVRSGLLKPKL